MTTVSAETLDALKEFDAATLFNAVVASMGGSQGGNELDSKGGVPLNYTGPEVVSMLPELGRAIGTVVTTEVTTNDPDSAAIPWDEYYDTLEATPGPIIAVMRDVDTRPGRGACFGDGMAWRHRMLGVTGAVVEGSVRDLAGIGEAGLPIWGTGRVPGHGVFNLVSVNRPVSVGGLLFYPGEIVLADLDGCTKIPHGTDPEDVLKHARQVREMEQGMFELYRQPGMTLAKLKELRNRG